ncbi:alpha-ketoglutarate-dependent dioxygenase AlkB family protein [Thalassomonas sp. M1454]|uniref:alpha-ketoglutarate-dependent dioxygenase AlkB family protein n=1 Tax=Thalassomonas sp. M1454 TaxID=2594477 RepID=UPI00118164E9|nr:alpha-ketoglutarate-dependent dioxygenase AlkB [Thalassomonas sp. M1454]TRX55787.1 alpha-ketoglutarate-dependent dioxygenase AlkB [Thalassomonas sp. M1454]
MKLSQKLSAEYFCSGDLIYIANFYQAAQSEQLCQALEVELVWRQETIRLFGKSVLIPRVQAWYGDKDAHYQYSGLSLTPLPWTATLMQIKTDVEQQISTTFNSVLANLYRNGQDSMGWHSDNEKQLGEQPIIASVSLGQERKFSIKHKSSGEKIDLILQSGSLLIMHGNLQQDWQHSIPKTKKIIDKRINLTFRTITGISP